MDEVIARLQPIVSRLVRVATGKGWAQNVDENDVLTNAYEYLVSDESLMAAAKQGINRARREERSFSQDTTQLDFDPVDQPERSMAPVGRFEAYDTWMEHFKPGD